VVMARFRRLDHIEWAGLDDPSMPVTTSCEARLTSYRKPGTRDPPDLIEDDSELSAPYAKRVIDNGWFTTLLRNDGTRLAAPILEDNTGGRPD